MYCTVSSSLDPLQSATNVLELYSCHCNKIFYISYPLSSKLVGGTWWNDQLIKLIPHRYTSQGFTAKQGTTLSSTNFAVIDYLLSFYFFIPLLWHMNISLTSNCYYQKESQENWVWNAVVNGLLSWILPMWFLSFFFLMLHIFPSLKGGIVFSPGQWTWKIMFLMSCFKPRP